VEHAGVSEPNIWTEQEDQILRDNYHDCTWPELYQLLPLRTHGAIRKRATRHGLSRSEKYLMCLGIEWTEDERHALTEMYEKATKPDLQAALPDRTWRAIVKRANKMGLKRDKALCNTRAEHPYRAQLKLRTERRVLDYVIDYWRLYGAGPIWTEIKLGTGLDHKAVTNGINRLQEKGLLVRPRIGRRMPIHLSRPFRERLEKRMREAA
jgi:hypothetical protein